MVLMSRCVVLSMIRGVFFQVGGHVLAGYKSIRGEFSPLELEILPVVVAARYKCNT